MFANTIKHIFFLFDLIPLITSNCKFKLDDISDKEIQMQNIE